MVDNDSCADNGGDSAVMQLDWQETYLAPFSCSLQLECKVQR